MVDSTSIIFALYMYWNRQTLCDQSRRRRVNNFKLKALNFLRIVSNLRKFNLRKTLLNIWITYLVWYPSERGGGCSSQRKTTTNRFKNHIIKFFFQSGYARSDTTAKTSLVVQSQSVWFWTNLNLLFYRNAIFQTLTWPVPWINQNHFVADITMVSSTFLLEWIKLKVLKLYWLKLGP